MKRSMRPDPPALHAALARLEQQLGELAVELARQVLEQIRASPIIATLRLTRAAPPAPRAAPSRRQAAGTGRRGRPGATSSARVRGRDVQLDLFAAAGRGDAADASPRARRRPAPRKRKAVRDRVAAAPTPRSSPAAAPAEPIDAAATLDASAPAPAELAAPEADTASGPQLELRALPTAPRQRAPRDG
jgi:hypothetical protein